MKRLIRKILKESDFDWVSEVEVNPWVEYDLIMFDVAPSEDKVNKLIEMALTTRAINNYEAWKTGREDDIESIVNYQDSYGVCYLVIDEFNRLSYGDRLNYFRLNKPVDEVTIRYSDLIKTGY